MISNGTAFTTSHRHYSHMIGCWNTGIFSWDNPKHRQLCLDTLDNWHSGQNAGACQMVGWSGKSKPGCVPDQDMTWEWDGFSYPFSSSANTRAGRPTAAMGNLTLMLRTVWPKRQLNWQCKHTGKPWPGSGDGGCIGASMQPNTLSSAKIYCRCHDPHKRCLGAPCPPPLAKHRSRRQARLSRQTP